jgi:hypothetical protein
MDVYSFPEWWLLGADESVFQNDDGTLKAQMQVMLGRMRGIPDDVDVLESGAPQLARADVKKFDAASPEPHLATVNMYAKLFAREASLPDSSVAITDFANPTSAEAYDSSQYELIAEAEGATDEWDPNLKYVLRIALAMQNGHTEVPDEYRTIGTQWRNPRYLSRAAMADAGSKQIAAVPELAQTEVGLELLGLDPQQIKRVMAERRRARVTGALSGLTVVADAADTKAKADAMGVLIRAGVAPADAAQRVGLGGLAFTGAVPTSLRLPEADASNLEGA